MAGDNGINLVLLGPPGSGKGTQAQLLANQYNLTHISTGEFLRQEVAKHTDLGKKVKEFIEKGELVPDSLVSSILKGQLNQQESKKGFILDGFPRNLNQAHNLDDILTQVGKALKLVIYFKTSHDVIIQRLSGRRVCGRCGANYHLINMPTKKPGICDGCGARLIQRNDDLEATVRKRIKVYEQQTQGLVDYYKTQGKLRIVSGNLDAKQVFKEIYQVLK